VIEEGEMHTIALPYSQRRTFSLTPDQLRNDQFRESTAFLGLFELQLQQLELIYDLRDRISVRAFLRTYPSFLPLLWKAPRYIVAHFCTYRSLVLEVFQDTDVTNWRELFVCIRTSLDPEQGVYALHQLDASWIADHPTGDSLNFDVEFI
jgi:hypothetical protein